MAEGCVSVKEGEVYKVHKHEVKAVAEVTKQCAIDGVKAHYACASCGLKYTDAAGTKLITDEATLVIPASHETVFVAAKAATCTEDGNKEHWYCDVCEQAFVNKAGDALAEDVVIKAAHTPSKVEAVAATCVKAGTKEHYKCTCGALFSDAEGKTSVTAEELATELVAHTLNTVDEIPATYTAPGVKAHYVCKVCAEKFLDAEGKTKATDADLAIAQLIEVVGEKAEVSTGAVDKAIEEAATSGDKKDVVLDLTHEEVVGEVAKPVTKTEIPVAAIEKVAEAEASLTLTKEDATVTLDTKALDTVAKVVKEEGAVNVTLSVKDGETKELTVKQQEAVKVIAEEKKVAKVISAELLVQTAAGEKKICTEGEGFGGGTVTVKIPFTPETGFQGSDYMVIYVADDGSTKEIPTAFKDGCLVVELEHFSDYVIVNDATNAGGNGGTGEAQPTEPTTPETTKPATKPGKPAPNTGDDANIFGLFAMLMVSGLLATALLVFKKKARA